MKRRPIASVALVDVVGATRPIYPEPKNWDATVSYMKGDPIEWEAVSWLLDDLQAGRPFREPVYVGDPNDLEEDETVPYVYNGTHRMVAHILHGSEFIDVAYENADGREEDESDDEYDYRVVETTVRFDKELTENENEKVFNILRSFRISDDVWVTSDVMSSRDNRIFELMWDVRENDPILMQRISDACVERLARHGNLVPDVVDTHYEEMAEDD